jgi:hypothetical protein
MHSLPFLLSSNNRTLDKSATPGLFFPTNQLTHAWNHSGLNTRLFLLPFFFAILRKATKAAFEIPEP